MREEAARGSTGPGGTGHGARVYFGRTIWEPEPKDLGAGRRLARRLARLGYLVVNGFRDHRCIMRAQALTFMTMLALVPLLALVFSISKGLGLQTAARREIVERLALQQQDIAERIIDYVDRTDVTALGAVGLLILLYTAIGVLGNIERSFNDIWGVTASRSLARRFSDYLSVLVIWPILLIASTGVTASLTSNGFLARLLSFPFVTAGVHALVRIVPILTVCAALTFIYLFVPNTRVRLRAGLVAGLAAGILWHLAQWIYIHFQVGVARYNAVYGTFASLPIFLVWLQASWVVVLLGAEIAYSVQHVGTYHPPVPEGSISIARRERVALQCLGRVWERFEEGLAPLTPGDLAAEVDLPRPATIEIVRTLVGCGLLARAESGETVLPTRDLGRTPAGDVLIVVRHGAQPRRAAPAGGGVLAERVISLHGRLEDALRAAGEAGLAQALDLRGRAT